MPGGATPEARRRWLRQRARRRSLLILLEVKHRRGGTHTRTTVRWLAGSYGEGSIAHVGCSRCIRLLRQASWGLGWSQTGETRAGRRLWQSMTITEGGGCGNVRLLEVVAKAVHIRRYFFSHFKFRFKHTGGSRDTRRPPMIRPGWPLAVLPLHMPAPSS